jgi:hypothetical protein
MCTIVRTLVRLLNVLWALGVHIVTLWIMEEKRKDPNVFSLL